MRAGVLYGKGDIHIAEVDRPRPGTGEVLVRVALSGICGSDIPRVFGEASRRLPNILGHEFSGTVEELGDGVTCVGVGDHVVGVPLVPCHECPDCRAGNFSLCGNYSFVGSRQDGSFAEYVALPERNVVKIDPSVPLDRGAFFEPATVAVHALMLALDGARQMDPGTSVLIIGGGTIGILLAQWLGVWGVRDPVVLERSADRIEAVRSAGLDCIIDAAAADAADRLAVAGGAGGFDYVFECAGMAATVKQAVALAGNRSTVCFIGTPEREVVFSVREWEQINRKELCIRGSWMSYSAPFPGVEWSLAARHFATGDLRISDKMIDSVVPLGRIDEAFDLFAEGRRPRGKVLVDSCTA